MGNWVNTEYYPLVQTQTAVKRVTQMLGNAGIIRNNVVIMLLLVNNITTGKLSSWAEGTDSSETDLAFLMVGV